MEEQRKPEKRPTVILLVCLYFAYNSIFPLFLGIIFLGDTLQILYGLFQSNIITIIKSVLVFSLPPLQLTTAYGLWKFKSWSYNLAIVLAIIAVPLSVLGVLNYVSQESIIHGTKQIIFALVVIWLLLKPEIKKIYIKD